MALLKSKSPTRPKSVVFIACVQEGVKIKVLQRTSVVGKTQVHAKARLEESQQHSLQHIRDEPYISINISKRSAVHRRLLLLLLLGRLRLDVLLWPAVWCLVERFGMYRCNWCHGGGRSWCRRLFAVCRRWCHTCICPFLVCGLLQSISMLLEGK